MTSYTYAKLSDYDLYAFRVGGPGLGNLLFPWARSVVSARKHNAISVWPTWPQLKLGPILRGEFDKRTYTSLFKTSDEYISGTEKFVLLNNPFVKKCNEHDLLFNGRIGHNQLIVFKGMKGLFEPILDEHEMVKNELIKIIHKPFNKDNYKQDYIAVHIRFGDFAKYDASNEGLSNNMRLPIKWYVDLIKQLNVRSNSRLTFKIFSDANNSELKEVLALDNVQRAHKADAITDLLKMMSAKALIASNSTFSMWAAYLGRMPVIWHPSCQKNRLYTHDDEHEIQIGNDALLSDSILNRIITRH